MLHSEAAKVFAKIDVNGDGKLSRIEVIKAVRNDASVRVVLGLPETIREGDARAAFESVFQMVTRAEARASPQT